MADYYFHEDQPVPFDISMLAADRVRWTADDNIGFRVSADFRAVSSIDEGQEYDRPYFARRAFEATEKVQVAGFLPWLRQGWSSFRQIQKI